MKEPLFLGLDDVLQIHQDTIDHEGGGSGVRDIALIDSAVAAPRASFGGAFLHPDLAAMTAALMFALIGNHGFIDGNKRVGTLAALVFRQVNGIPGFPPADELEQTAMAVARGEMDREALAQWWRSFS
jgi:death-on-curing protein